VLDAELNRIACVQVGRFVQFGVALARDGIDLLDRRAERLSR